MQKSTNQISNQDLQIALNSILTSVKIIYFNFEFVFKLLGLFIIALLAYKIGKLSVSEKIAKKVKEIQNQIKQVESQKQQLPTKIKNIKSMYTKIIVLFLLIAIGGLALLLTEHIKIDIMYIGIAFVIPIVIYIIKVIHTSSLKQQKNIFSIKQKEIKEKVKEINKQLGSKVQSILKYNFCRDKINARQNAPVHICTKKDCQLLRELLKQRYEAIRSLAQCALQFQWCSTCKARKPFDELVMFEAKAMPVRDGDISQEQDADIKINYLLQTLEQIDKWILDAGPCNCSKLYMEQILKNRRNVNKLLKQLNSKIEIQRQKQAANRDRAISRTDSKMSNVSNVSSTSNISNVSNLSSGVKIYYPSKKTQ